MAAQSVVPEPPRRRLDLLYAGPCSGTMKAVGRDISDAVREGRGRKSKSDASNEI